MSDNVDKDAGKAEHSAHRFRYLLPPGNNFQFVSKFRAWLIVSIILMAACVGMLFVNKSVRGNYMNWTIDFKGGTEMIFSFAEKAGGKYIKPDVGKVREVLEKGGEEVEVSDIGFDDEQRGHIDGLIVRSPRFSALKPEAETKARDDFYNKFNKDREISKAAWSGDRLYVKSKKVITPEEAKAIFVAAGLDPNPWSADETSQFTHADEGTGEFSEVYSMKGLASQFEKILDAGQPTLTANIENSYGVGAKAGDKLRDDAAKSVVYAIFLIMLYLAFRFDIRYAPGAAFATIHDAFMVIGVFAVTWSEVSLTTVAGLLTVMGYSVNDTVIVFDRIRENQAKLKDKKIERIIDISINEMLVRTILTSSTVFATTLIMNIFGTGLVKNFAFAMNIGVIVGTYSSIFLAAPIFMWISKKYYSGPAKARNIPRPVEPSTVAEE